MTGQLPAQKFLPLLGVAISGILFGLGLSVAQMIDPAKVVNFLDLFGTWDPSLALVMVGGLLINAIATPFIFKRNKPLLEQWFRLPDKTAIDKRLVIGGVIFGVGWGLAGYCPGPMLVSLSFADSDIVLIISSYLIGTFLTRWWLARA